MIIISDTEPKLIAANKTSDVSPMTAIHESLGATFVEWNGVLAPQSYRDSPLEVEHHAVRTRAGLFDVSSLRFVHLEGRDAFAALETLFTRSVDRVENGKAAYGLFLSQDGTITDDAIFYRFDRDRGLLVHGSGSAGDDLLAAGAPGVRPDPAMCDLALQGPAAVDVLANVLGEWVRTLRYFRVVETELFGRSVTLARTGYTGERGYEIFCHARDAPDVWTGLLEAGQWTGVIPCSFGCMDLLEIEAGLLYFPCDMNPRTTPWQLGLGWTLDKEKLDYRGRLAALSRRSEEASTSIATVSIETKEIPAEGTAITNGSQPVGWISCSAPWPAEKKTLAKAHLIPALGVPGSELLVLSEEPPVAAKVLPTPLYRNPAVRVTP